MCSCCKGSKWMLIGTAVIVVVYVVIEKENSYEEAFIG
jgi:hypothetical protein